MQASSNVSALTLDAMGNYASGGMNQYAVVVQDTSSAKFGDVTLPAGSAAKALGVNMGAPAGPGDPVQCRVEGIARCRAASAISLGDTVMVADTSGRIATATAATANFVVGRALEAATAANQIITVLLDPSDGKVTMP
jgi:hypothetical protein